MLNRLYSDNQMVRKISPKKATQSSKNT